MVLPGIRTASEAKRLNALEYKNATLKKLLAGALLDVAMLQDVAAKKECLARGERPWLICEIFTR